MFKIFIIFALAISSYAGIDDELKNHFEIASSKTDVEKKLLIAFAKTESSLNKFSIGIIAKNPEMLKKFFEINNVTFFQGKDKNKNLFSLKPKNKDMAEEYFYKFKYFVKKYPYAIKTYDIGLMQINATNIKGNDEKEMMYLLNTKINILKGASIVQECYGKFKNVKYAIECYNKGTDSRKFKNFDYFNLVANNYKEIDYAN